MLDVLAQEMIRTYSARGISLMDLIMETISFGTGAFVDCNFNCRLRSFSENHITLTFITIK